MSDVRTVFTFRGPSFRTTDCPEHSLYGRRCGGDVACWLIRQLRARHIRTTKDPGLDLGHYFVAFRVGRADYHVVIRYHKPCSMSFVGFPSEGSWVGWLERKPGLLALMFDVGKRDVQANATAVIHSVLSSSPEISGVEWHNNLDELLCELDLAHSRALEEWQTKQGMVWTGL